MDRALRLALCAVAGVLAAAGPVRAGSISISIGPRVTFEGGNVVAHLHVTNGGDEAAHSVTPTLSFGDKRLRGDTKDQLAPNEAIDPVLTLPVGDVGQGRWVYRVTVDYTDANQYPFQALHVGLISLGSPPPAKVVVPGIQAEPVTSDGSLKVRVKNLAGAERRATVAVLVPEGVEVTGPARELSLAAWEEETVAVPLVNRTALPGSRYPVFATVAYDDEGTHQAVVAQGTLDVRAPQSFFQTRQTALWVGAGVLFVLWLGAVAWWAIGRARGGAPRPT
jgi:hypothetical protein